MGIFSHLSAREISGCMIFFVILIFGSKSFAYDNPAGFISIDCGSVSKNSTDPQTNLLWVDDGDYIISGDNGLIDDEDMSLVSYANNHEALKSFRYFREEEMQSKYCYEVPMRKSNASFLLRAMFLHGNATDIGFPSAFYYYINGSLTFILNYTGDSPYLFDPAIAETIFFPPSYGSKINVCLVPVQGTPFISSLELRELDSEGIMYTKSFGDRMHEGVFFFNIIRWNLGAPNASTVRYPYDPYDRLWTPPTIAYEEFQNISSPPTWSQLGSEVNNIPSEVMNRAWVAADPDAYSIRVLLPYVGLGFSTYGIFYFAILDDSIRSTRNNTLTVSMALDTIHYPSFNITKQPSQETLFHTLNADFVAVQFNDSFVLNAIEWYAQQSFVIPTTNLQTVNIVNRIKDIFDMRKWQGDPCTPISYNWLTCELISDQGSEYFVIGLTLSGLPNVGRITELKSTDENWVVSNVSITNSNINSELFQFLFRDWINATQLLAMNMSFNAIDTFPGGEWWTDVAGHEGPAYSLLTLDLSSNQLRQIPPFVDFPFSSTLQSLNLSKNLITGDFPNESYFSNLTSLRVLNLSFNNLTGAIPWSLSLQNLPNLTILDLSNNSFSQEFPSAFYFDMNGTFQSLYADNNEFTGVLNLRPWYNKIQTALSNTSTLHSTFDSPPITFNQSFSFRNNKISSIEPSAVEFQSVIERLIERDDFNRSGVLLGGNPYCKNAKGFAQRFLCRSSIEDVVNLDVKKRNKTPIILGSVFGGVFLIVCFAFFTWRIWKLSRAVDSLLVERELSKRKVQPPYYFYSDLKSATQNFHVSKHLGRGNFGAVYKGVLSDGTTIAVKNLFNSEQNQVLDEFLNEVVLITGIKHKNLIQLKGCCIENQERILVYGYAENGNIEDALWGRNSEVTLSWENRFKIIVGVASGLTYLHEKLQPRIIHRDIKAANILLDKTFDSKIADFGLAKHFVEDIDVHVTEVIAGTRGYFAPEYLSEGRVSTKIDVFSFGVLALEIVSGRRCLDSRLRPEEVQLTSWALKLQKSGSLLELLDPAVGTDYSERQALKTMNIALMCVRYDPELRPTMSEVETMLLEGQESLYQKLHTKAVQKEERDLSQDLIYKQFSSGMGPDTLAMLFPSRGNSTPGGASGSGSGTGDAEDRPLLQRRSVETFEELPSFDTGEAFNRQLRSMNRSLSERILRGSSSGSM